MNDPITQSRAPRCEYRDTNKNGILDDQDVVTIHVPEDDGRTQEIVQTAGAFAEANDASRNLVIKLAADKKMDCRMFAKNHPLKNK